MSVNIIDEDVGNITSAPSYFLILLLSTVIPQLCRDYIPWYVIWSQMGRADEKGLAPHRTNYSEDVDLVSFLSSKSQRHDAIFTEAVQLLESMKSSPSCHRVAATRLVTSCQSIGGKSDNIETDTYIALDHLRSLYAARLAICEINGAGTATPHACLPVTISPQHKKGFFGFSSTYNPQVHLTDSIPTDLQEPCLRSLESRPQWWTSYSNSRQNAMVICQASRIESEKEELLELHRFVVESTAKLNHGLQEALRTATEDSAQHKAFMDVIATMRVRLVHELEESETLFKRAIANILHDIRSGVDSAVTGVNSMLGRVQMDAAALEKVGIPLAHSHRLTLIGSSSCIHWSGRSPASSAGCSR